MISVAMAAYNGEKYIEEQIRSILLNLAEEDELVISDDGSADGTENIIKRLSETDHRIRAVNGPQEGIIANFQHAVSLCRGEYIFLSDQDDVWEADKVQKVMKVFADTGCGLVMHDAAVYDQDLKEQIMPSFFEYRGSRSGTFANILKNRYMGCCMAFSAELVPHILPIPCDIQMHDQWIGLVNDIRKGGTELIREPLIRYRRHENANSDFGHNTVAVMIRNRMILIRELHRAGKRIKGTQKENNNAQH